MDERRTFKRLPAEAEVRVRRLDSSTETKAASRDLSGGGIQFMSNELLPVGTLVEVEVIPPSHPNFTQQIPPLRACIRIVRVQGEMPPYEIAGEFIEMLS